MRAILLIVLLVFSAASFGSLSADARADLSRFVVVGDSLAAGFQNLSLLGTQQVNGPAALIAAQARVELDLPLVPYPGIPNVLTLVSPELPPIVQQVPGPPPANPRENSVVQVQNLAVPGHTVSDAIEKRPSVFVATLVDALTNVVLGYPTPFITSGPPRSQLESAVALSPTFVLQWIGNNDALTAALTGDATALTSASSFAASYRLLSRELAATRAVLVMVNIPDVTAIPYFTSIQRLSAQTGVPAAVIASQLGVQSTDLLRPGAIAPALAILSGQLPGPMSAVCPSSIPVDLGSTVPCVLRASEAALIRGRIQLFNQVIAANAAEFKAALVDAAALAAQLARQGYTVAGRRLTTDYLGGLFSLDAVHPTNTGYAILANEILEQMKRQLDINVTQVNVVRVAREDPLVIGPR